MTIPIAQTYLCVMLPDVLALNIRQSIRSCNRNDQHPMCTHHEALVKVRAEQILMIILAITRDEGMGPDVR